MKEPDVLVVVPISYDDSTDFDIYILAVQVQLSHTRPLTIDQRIVAVGDLALLPRLLGVAPEQFRALGPVPTDFWLECDLTVVLRLLTSKTQQSLSPIVNFIDIYQDLLGFTAIKCPASIYNTLTKLAVAAFELDEVATIYKERKLTRGNCVTSVIWLYGAVMSNIRVYEDWHLQQLEAMAADNE